MKVFTCNSFKGHYPVGVGAVVMAEDAKEAATLLEAVLVDRGLQQDIAPEQMVEMQHQVVILCDGNY